MNHKLITSDFTIGSNADGLFVHEFQDIPEDFMARNRALRDGTAKDASGEFLQFASIPVVVIDQWIREGFNIFDPNINPKDIVARLKRAGLDDFLTTNKRV